MKFKTLRISLLAVLLLGAMLLSACTEPGNNPDGQSGSQTEAPKDFASVDMAAADLSAQALAEHLLANVKFEDPSLVPMEKDIAEALYGITGLVKDAASYGSMAIAEAVLIVRCESAENAAAAREKIDAYRLEMADIYASYNEPESVKLKKAFLASDGVYVVYCVCPDAAAAEDAYHSFVVEAVYGTETAAS